MQSDQKIVPDRVAVKYELVSAFVDARHVLRTNCCAQTLSNLEHSAEDLAWLQRAGVGFIAVCGVCLLQFCVKS